MNDLTDMLVATRWEVDGRNKSRSGVMIVLSQSVCFDMGGTCEVTGCEVGIIFSFPCCCDGAVSDMVSICDECGKKIGNFRLIPAGFTLD